MSTATMKLQREPLMPLAQQLLAEFEEQVPVTRKFLERLPEDKLTWKPHAKSMSAGQLALHIAGVPGGVIRGAQQNPAQAPDFNNIPQPSSLREVLDTFEQSVDTVRNLLPQFDDRQYAGDLAFVRGRQGVVRHTAGTVSAGHHAQPLVSTPGPIQRYLRLLNVAVPSSWGPSADEQPNFA